MTNGSAPLEILVIDDSPEDRELYRRLLTTDPQTNYSITVAQTAAEGRRSMKRTRPDCVLLDYRLPDADGLALLDELATEGNVPPVVMLTGHGSESIAVRAVKAGVDDYLVKERLSAPTLIGSIRTAIERTQARNAERVAQEALNRLAAIVESSEDAIVGLTLQGTITSWNPAAERLYGDRADEAIGRPLPALFRCSSGSCADLLDKIRRGEPERCEGVHVNKAGVRLDVSMAVSPIRDHSGKPVGASLIARDVSEPKRTEAELQRRAVDLARSNADLQQFAYHASHDLQEPLRNIISFAELLAARYRGRLDDDADDFIEFILDGTSRMRALIRDLLEFSRVARTERILEPVALDRIVEQARTNLAASIDEARAVVKSSTLPIVRGNASELLRVFQNLIGNAVKFRAADRHPAIEISATEGADAWEISFADNGIGIDPRFHERVFEVFRRLHGPEEYAGTGIGLSICRKIVELHGGRIWVESKPGEGATFTLALPKEAPRSLHPTAAPTTD